MSDRMQNLYEGVSLLVKLANEGPILRLADGTELEGDAAADYLDERRARLSDDLDQFDRALESRRPKRTIGWHALTAGSGGLLGGILGNAVTYAASPKVRAVGTAAGILGGSALGLGAAERDLSNRQKDYDTRAEVLRQVVHGGYQPNLANLDSLAKHFRAQGASASQEKTSGLRDAVTRGARRYWELMTGANVPSKDAFKNTKRLKENVPEVGFLDETLKTMLSERNKMRATRAGTALGLGAGGYGVGAALKGQRGDLADAVEKSASLLSKVQRGARRWKEGITGEMLDGANVRGSDRALRDNLKDLRDDPMMDFLYRHLDDGVKAQEKELRHVVATRLGTAAALGAGGYGVHTLAKRQSPPSQEKTSGLRDAVARGASRYKELLTGSRRAKPYQTKALKESRDEVLRSIRKRKELGLDSPNRESQLEYFNKLLRQDRAEDLKVLGTRIGTMGVIGAGLVGAARKRAAGERRIAEDIRNQVPEEGLE